MIYVMRRLAFLILTLLITSVMVFSITQWLPGDVARIILGREAGEAALNSFREEWGLDDPIVVQYWRWLAGYVTGDWGTSFATKTEIRPMVVDRVRNSVMLATLTMLISVPPAIGLGVIAGLRENKIADHLIGVTSLSVVGLPEFVTGVVLIQVFAFRFRILPANSSIRMDATFFEALPMLVLPAMTASLVLLAYVIRLTRAGVIEELKKPYVRTAVVKGMPGRTVIIKHVLRNSLLPTITVVAISFGWLLSGLIVVENVFNYPGLGRLLIFAIDRRDFPLMQAIAMVTAAGFAVANLIADVLYAILNPRIRLG